MIVGKEKPTDERRILYIIMEGFYRFLVGRIQIQTKAKYKKLTLKKFSPPTTASTAV